MDTFPFAAGIAAQETHNHADGTTTIRSHTPWVYIAPAARDDGLVQPVERQSLEPWQCLNCDDNAAFGAIIADLRTGGTSVLRQGKGQAEGAWCKLLEDANGELGVDAGSNVVAPGRESVFKLLTLPLVMRLCNAVLGAQVLRIEDADAFAECVVPPSLFTHHRTLLQLPWELDSVKCTEWDAQQPPSRAAVDHFRLPRLQLGLSVAISLNGGQVVFALGDELDLYKAAVLGKYATTWLVARYHVAVMSQRENLYLRVPPAVALSLPEHMQRLLGYAMPGQVLNKLYCGGPPHSILAAFENYGGRRIDWARPVRDCPSAEHWASMVPASVPSTVDWAELTANMGHWIARLPPGDANGLVTVPSKAEKAAELLVAALARDGAVVLGEAASPELCEALLRDIAPYSEDVGGAAVGSVCVRSPASWPIAGHPVLLEAVEGVLGRQALLKDEEGLRRATKHAPELKGRIPWQIHVSLTIPKQPGSEAQELHRDGDLSLLDLPYEHAVSVICAVDGDFTEERGTTRVVLGSHNWPRSRTALPQESVPAVMRRGSALIYTGRSIHGAGHNRSSKPRVAYNVAYNSACLKQEENMFVAAPPELAAATPPLIQQMLGYSGGDAL